MNNILNKNGNELICHKEESKILNIFSFSMRLRL